MASLHLGMQRGSPVRALSERPVGSLTGYPSRVPEAVLLLGQTCRAGLEGAQVWVLEGAQLVHRDHLPMGEPAKTTTGDRGSDTAH